MENVAHISNIVVTRPSIFELIATDSLDSLLNPSLKKIVLLFARRPSSFARRWFEELFAVLNALLQYHYLTNYGGTFSEKFYNLKRLPDKFSELQKRDYHLPIREKIVSLLLVVLYPYIRERLRQRELKIMEKPEEMRTPEEKNTFKCIRAIVQLSNVCSFVYAVGYLTGKLSKHSLLLTLAKVTLIHDASVTNDNAFWSRLWTSYTNKEAGILRTGMRVFRHGLLHSVEIAAFMVQFLHYWNLQHGRKKVFDQYPIPPAPENETNENLRNVCPVCRKSFSIATVVKVSGYVYCYKCIKGEISQNGRCPISRIPISIDDLIRLRPGTGAIS